MLVTIRSNQVVIVASDYDITTTLTMTPTTARAMAADLIKAADTLEPPHVKIERWLTEEDIEKYGDRWMWHWLDDDGVESKFCTAILSETAVQFRFDSDPKEKTRPWESGSFKNGDYFTPIREEAK